MGLQLASTLLGLVALVAGVTAFTQSTKETTTTISFCYLGVAAGILVATWIPLPLWVWLFPLGVVTGSVIIGLYGKMRIFMFRLAMFAGGAAFFGFVAAITLMPL